MSTTTTKPATTPIPIQLFAPAFTSLIFPHLTMPKRGSRCKLCYHQIFPLIVTCKKHRHFIGKAAEGLHFLAQDVIRTASRTGDAVCHCEK